MRSGIPFEAASPFLVLICASYDSATDWEVFFMKHAPGFLAIVNDAKTRVKELDFREVKNRLDAGEKLKLGKGVIERDIETQVPDKSTPLVLYCGGGFRSALAVDNLQKMGYTNCISMDGGWRSWNEAGFPTTKTES
jgi:rhodanese-related sulfurtransferase